MARITDSNPGRTPFRPKPDAILGAGKLVSTVWKAECHRGEHTFRFNLFRMGSGGRVGHRFTPADLIDLIKLTRLLAMTMADEGDLSASRREEFVTLASKLDHIADRNN